jgi:hypothetical protein
MAFAVVQNLFGLAHDGVENFKHLRGRGVELAVFHRRRKLGVREVVSHLAGAGYYAQVVLSPSLGAFKLTAVGVVATPPGYPLRIVIQQR